MANAARVNFNVQNLTQSVSNPITGISFVQGQSIRGPFSNPETIITSWSQFVSIHGGLSGVSDSPLLCKRLLEKGGAVRFNRVGSGATIATQGETTVLTFDSEITTGTTELTISGVEISIPFDTDNDTTLDNLATAIKAIPIISTVEVVESSVENGNRVLLISSLSDLTISDISTPSGVTLVDSLVLGVLDKQGNKLFSVKSKYKGLDYNNFKMLIKEGSNGASGYFDIELSHSGDLTIFETYVNLSIDSKTSANESNYLNKIVSESKYFEITYEDISNISEDIVEVFPAEYKFKGGTNEGTLTDTDWIGDSASKTGFHAFDDYADGNIITVLQEVSDAVNIAGSAYAANRKDLVYFLELSNSLNTTTTLISSRETLNIDTKYTYIFAGGLKITDPITSAVKDIKAIADVIALAINSDKSFGPWYSFAGPNRGLINNVLGVVNNFGASANTQDLNLLANKHINMVINRGGSVKLWGNFSAQYKNDQESQISIVRLVMYLSDSLRPAVENFLEEPNDIPTWKRLYYTVKPFLDSMVTKRALYSYVWQGDQNASSIDNLEINNATDVGNGKYKVNLLIKAIPSIQEINIGIILTPTGVDFEVVSELT